MTDEERQAIATALNVMMSDISETHYAAGWMQGLGPDLWQIVQAGGGDYGMGAITPATAQTLRRLAEMAGGWWWDDEDFVPLAELEARTA